MAGLRDVFDRAQHFHRDDERIGDVVGMVEMEGRAIP
jgi:hypothetical protein